MLQSKVLPNVEYGPTGKGFQLVRCVVDTIQNCNLRCQYCHPGKVWIEEYLDIKCIRDLFAAAEQYGLPEVVLTGGEITLHPQLEEILHETNNVKRTGITLITNATNITETLLDQFRHANITRICVSVDGPDAETHDSARGKTFDQVMQGLQDLQTTGIEITVISVAHQKNFRSLVKLSYLLAENKLATQHHLCAPSYSGLARRYYGKLKLEYDDFYVLRDQVNEVHDDLNSKGLFLTFNSFWPVTGERSSFDRSRTLTLQQITEQTKDIYVIARSNGDFRLTQAAWGRETVGNAVIGNLYSRKAYDLFLEADQIYRNGLVKQLPRHIEAMHKFQVSSPTETHLIDKVLTDRLVDDHDADQLVQMVPITTLADSTLLDSPIDYDSLASIARSTQNSDNFRFMRHSTNTYLIFDRNKSHITLLTEAEWSTFLKIYEENVDTLTGPLSSK